MPTSADPAEPAAVDAGPAAKARTPEEREELLATNRRTREEVRSREEARADKDDSGRVPGRVQTPRAGAGRGAVALAAVAAVAAIAAAVFGFLWATADRDGLGPDSELGRQALSDAQSYAAQIVTYTAGDYSALDKKIRAISTQEFADRYIEASQEARQGNDEANASSTGAAVAAGLESLTEERAVVLVALDQQWTSPEVPSVGDGGVPYQSRVQLTLTREGDRWIVADLTTV